MVDQPLLDAAQWAANFALWGSLFFPLVTSRFWPWWQSWWGWNIVSFDLALGGTSFPYMLVLDWKIRGTWLVWTEVFFLSASFAIIAWRTVMIWTSQREGAARDREPVG
jgi:hypothetical protein